MPASAGSVRAMSTANGRSMSVPKRGHGPTVETRVPGGRRAVVHRLDAAAAVSTAQGDVGCDRHAGQGGHYRREHARLWGSLRHCCGCPVVVRRAEPGIAYTEGVFERVI